MKSQNEKNFTNFAFTLAEVLITLSIIGVVAAMTLPPLVANVREKSLESAKQKAQSSLVNGYKQLMAKEGLFKFSDLPLLNCTNASCFSQYHKEMFKIVNDSTSGLTSSAYPQDYILEDGNDAPFKWSDVPYLFRTADGMSYGVEIDDEKDSISIFADINGQKRPNTVCKDMLKFRFLNNGNIANVCSELAESKCSIDNISECSYQQCQALETQRIRENNDQSPLGMWNSQGHFIAFNCSADGNHFTADWCTGFGGSLYCR